MAWTPQEDIGAEVHNLHQFFRPAVGRGEAVPDGVLTVLQAVSAVEVVSARHSPRRQPAST